MNYLYALRIQYLKFSDPLILILKNTSIFHANKRLALVSNPCAGVADQRAERIGLGEHGCGAGGEIRTKKCAVHL